MHPYNDQHFRITGVDDYRIQHGRHWEAGHLAPPDLTECLFAPHGLRSNLWDRHPRSTQLVALARISCALAAKAGRTVSKTRRWPGCQLNERDDEPRPFLAAVSVGRWAGSCRNSDDARPPAEPGSVVR